MALKILILTAVMPEAQVLIQGLNLTKVSAPVSFWTRKDVALALVGIRATRLQSFAQMPAIASVRGILMAGLAGALAPELHIGDIVCAPISFPQKSLLPEAHFGNIHTAGAIVATAKEKQALFAATSCLAADMETAHAQRFATDRRANFLSIRAISDAAADPLDPAMLQLVDPDGKPRVFRAIAMLARHPSKLPEMLRLQRATSLAMRNLSNAVRKIVDSGWPDSSTHPPAVT